MPELHPEAVFVTVTEYTVVPVTVGIAVVVAALGEPLMPGPVHAYVFEPTVPVAFAIRFTVPPRHIGPVLVGAAVGTGFTLTFVVYAVPELHPEAVFVTITEYTVAPVTVGIAVVVAVLREPVIPGPVHENVFEPTAPVAFAIRFTVPPRHIGPLLVGAAVGTGFTLTLVVYAVPELHPEAAFVTITEYTAEPAVVGIALAVGELEEL